MKIKRLIFTCLIFLLTWQAIGGFTFVAAAVPSPDFTNTEDINSWLSVYPYYISGSSSGHIATSGADQYVVNDNRILPIRLGSSAYEFDSMQDFGQIQLSPTEIGLYKRYTVKLSILTRSMADTSLYIKGPRTLYYDFYKVYSRDPVINPIAPGYYQLRLPENYDYEAEVTYFNNNKGYEFLPGMESKDLDFGANVAFKIQTNPNKFTFKSRLSGTGGYYNFNGSWNSISEVKYYDTEFEGGLIEEDNNNYYLQDSIIESTEINVPNIYLYYSPDSPGGAGMPPLIREVFDQCSLITNSFYELNPPDNPNSNQAYVADTISSTPAFPKPYTQTKTLDIYKSFENYQTASPYKYSFDPKIMTSNQTEIYTNLAYSLIPKTTTYYQDWYWKNMIAYQTTQAIYVDPFGSGFPKIVRPPTVDSMSIVTKSARDILGFSVQNVYSVHTISISVDIVAKYNFVSTTGGSTPTNNAVPPSTIGDSTNSNYNTPDEENQINVPTVGTQISAPSTNSNVIIIAVIGIAVGLGLGIYFAVTRKNKNKQIRRSR